MSRSDDGVALVDPAGEPTVLAEAELRAVETTERTVEVRCASGRRSESTWVGVPLAAVVERADVPPETTHLVVADGDGYRSRVEVGRALECLLAFGRDGAPVESEDRPRLVGPGLAGVRAVKGVETIAPVSLAPGEDPEAFETPARETRA